MNHFIKISVDWLTSYVYYAGDDRETVLRKKIWWVLLAGGLPILLLGSYVIGHHEGEGIFIMNVVFIASLLLSLSVFHFYRQQIEWYAFVTQMGIVLISSVKVYLMGGLLHAGGAVFIGLIGPIYALTLPNKNRAIIVILLFLVLMTSATLLQPQTAPGYLVFHYFLGFTNGVITIFAALFYYNWQLEKIKIEKEKRMQELDEFKTKFYTNITHEFRTPLTIILGIADQIKESNNQVDLEEGLTMIKRNGEQLLSLTNQMLSLSKLEDNVIPVNLVQDDVATFIKLLVESFHSLAEVKNIQLDFYAKPEKIKMDFDPEKMQEIISNLLSNAIKFTPKGGRVQVTIFIEGHDLKKRLIISIKDSGVGISEAHLPKIFDRYYQVDQYAGLTEGTGLGLALTRELIKLLNGEIEVESLQGKGSTFSVLLPITNQAELVQTPLKIEGSYNDFTIENSDQDVLDMPAKEDEKLTVLIVDDNRDVLRYLRSLLEDEYQVLEALNGQEGFEKAIEMIPDLVISDVMMPKMDGFTFCKKIKTDLRTSHIPVVLLTAKADSVSKLEGLEAGAEAYLIKPFNRKELFVRVKKLIELRKALQERYTLLLNNQNASSINENDIYEKEDQFLQDVRRQLIKRMDEEEFGISGLCLSLGMSRSQLYRKFKALTNTTVHHFIRDFRLDKAKDLLLTTDLNVTEVVFETGFKNLSHFSKIFMERFGESPSKFRKNKVLDN